MREVLVKGKSLPEAYHKAIIALNDEGAVLSCSDYNQLQKELSMTFVAEDALAEPMISRLYIGGFRELQQYVMEVLDGVLDFKIGDGNCWEYTYHNRMRKYPIYVSDSGAEKKDFDQVGFVLGELRRNADSRRAVISMRDNSVDPFNANPACLQNLQYLIRDGSLHCKVLMRSNDATEATFMNAFAFILLQEKIAGELGLPVGSYTHRANSFHCYEKDFNLLAQYVDGIKNKPHGEITYEYKGFFKDLMEESIPEIVEMISNLKAQSSK